MPRNKKMDVSKLSDENIQDMFEEAFEDQIASYNNIGNFECKCTRDEKAVTMEVMIVGLAGTPCVDDYKNAKVENADAVRIQAEDKGSLKFVLASDEIASLNTNDYTVVYRAK